MAYHDQHHIHDHNNCNHPFKVSGKRERNCCTNVSSELKTFWSNCNINQQHSCPPNNFTQKDFGNGIQDEGGFIGYFLVDRMFTKGPSDSNMGSCNLKLFLFSFLRTVITATESFNWNSFVCDDKCWRGKAIWGFRKTK